MAARSVRLLVQALLAVLLLAHCLRFVHHTTDDAFISFRYAQSLSQGRGATYNPGDRVEGYSNPSWVLALAALSRLSVEPELAAKGIGLACGIACLFLGSLAVRLCARSLGTGGDLLVPLLLVSSSSFALWIVGGLETGLNALLLLALPLALQLGWPVAAGLLAGLLALTRPEGALLAMLVTVAGLIRRHRRGCSWVLRFSASWIPVVAVHLLVRLCYYGSPLPHTFLAKSGGGLEPLAGSAYYLYSFLMSGLPVPVTLCALWAMLARHHEGPLFDLPPWLIAGQLAAIASVGGDWMPMYRLLVVLLPLLLVLAVAGVDDLVALVPPRSMLPAGVVLVVGLVLSALGLFAVPLEEMAHLRFLLSLGHLQDRVGEMLRTAGGRSVAVGDIGRIGYRSGLVVVDTKGLVTPRAVSEFTVMATPTGRTVDPRSGWVFEVGPDWILLLVEKRADGTVAGFFPNDRSLLADRRLSELYTEVAEVRDGTFPVVYRVHRRRAAGARSW